MKATQSASVEAFRVASQFEGLRKTLNLDRYRRHLEKPLAYWALPTDRRLPLALLGRTLGDLITTPFDEIHATRGVGQKKIRSLVNLLSRAASTDPAELAHEAKPINGNGHGAATLDAGHSSDKGFDSRKVSEVVWEKWRASVVKHGLAHETLGRLAPSLRTMARVNWHSRLERYTDRTLAEIRAMRTHGEKRVRAILEVFYGVHELVAAMGKQDHLVVSISPRRIGEVERWINRTLRSSDLPTQSEIFDRFITPLLEQLEVDAGEQIMTLARNRLGISGPITSVREASRTMGLTRARLYQLLNEINEIILVRWPNGRRQAYDLRDKLSSEAAVAKPRRDLRQFLAAVELFYPSRHGGANGFFDTVETPLEEE